MILIIIGKIFILPLKKIFKLLINAIVGSGILYVTNLIGANFNFHIGLNWWTILCSGLLGVPGVILVIFLKLLIT